MEIKGKPFMVLYLTDWQKNMVKDFLGLDVDYWRIPIEKGPPFTLYGVPTHVSVKTKKMYLTDWQMREIKAEIGDSCEFIELTKKVLEQLHVPPPTVG